VREQPLQILARHVARIRVEQRAGTIGHHGSV
jgi:hypothetical protein